MQQNGRPNAEKKLLKLSNLTSKLTGIVHCDPRFVAIVNSVMNFSAAFNKCHGVSSIDALTVDISKYMAFSGLLTRNSLKSIRRWSSAAKCFRNPTLSSI